MAKIDVGVSSEAVLKFQKNLNNALKANIVPENGSFDEDTVDGLKKFQRLEGLKPTGKPDKATLQALDDALVPRILIKYKGRPVLLTKQQYEELKSRIAASLRGPANTYANIARDLLNSWTRHDQARSKHWFFAQMVDVAVGGKGFPAKSVFLNAVNVASGMQKAVASRNPAAIGAAFAREEAIRKAAAAMSQYEDELYTGGAGLIAELENIRDGCKFTLAVAAAIYTGGASLKVQVGVAAAVGAYDSMLGEVSKAGTDHKQTWSTAFGNIVADGVISGAVTRLMGGPKGKAFIEAIGVKVAAAAGPALKKIGKEALKTYVANAAKGSAKSAIEGFIKNLAKACNPNDKMTFDKAVDNIAKDLIKGMALGALDGKFASYEKNLSKQIPASAWKGLGEVKYDEALKAGGEQLLSQAYDQWAPSVINSSKEYPPNATKMLKELTNKITKDSKVQNGFAKIAKKIEKKKKKKK